MRTLFLLLSMLSAGLSSAETVNEVLPPSCKKVLSGEQRTDGAIYIDSTARLCWGSFLVIQKGAYYMDYPTRKRLWGICPPEGVGRRQMIAVFTKFAEDNPNLLHEDFTDVALASLKMTFPCK